MILQKIVWNQQSVEEPELYYKLKNGIKSESGILLNAGGEADFLTYMNIFSAEKWRKYTGIQSVCVSVNFKGKIKVVILLHPISSIMRFFIPANTWHEKKGLKSPMSE